MPLWFPFALVASFFVAAATGSKSGWKTQADVAEEERKRRLAQGPVVQGGPPRIRKGRWPYRGLPNRVTFEGRLFERLQSFMPTGVVGKYNELRGSGALVVLRTGRFAVVG